MVGAGSRGYLTTIGEYGWDASAGTFFAVDPSRELVVTLMTQNLPANPDGLRQKFKAAVLQSIVDQPVQSLLPPGHDVPTTRMRHLCRGAG